MNSNKEQSFSPSINFLKRENYKSFEINSSQLLPLLKKMMPKQPSLMDIKGVDLMGLENYRSERFRIVYSFYCYENDTFIEVVVHSKEGEAELPSIANEFPSAKWCERELFEMFGICFLKYLPKRLLTPLDLKGFPLRKNFENKNTHLGDLDFQEISSWEVKDSVCIEDQSPGAHETFFTSYGELGLSVEIDSEKIKKLHPHLGFQHRGIEKLFESLNYSQIQPVISLLNPKYRDTTEFLWVLAVEEMLNINLSEYAQAMRVIILELSRVRGHLLSLLEMSKAIGGGPEDRLFTQMLSEVDSFFKLIGDRIIIIGGVKSEMPQEWRVSCLEMLSTFLKHLNRAIYFYGKSFVFEKRMSLGGISKEKVLFYSASGVTMRASGVNFDLRKSNPFYFYKDLDFDIPLGLEGRCFDRFMVYLEEIKQSICIIEQVVDGLPLGKAHCWSGKGPLETNFELIEHFNHYTGNFRGKRESVTTMIEGGNGIWGISLTPGSDNKPYRVKIRTPSFFHLQLFTEIIKGEDYNDLNLIMNSMGICIPEIDR